MGDPQDALRVAVARARADGWSIQSVACQTSATRPTTYLVYGVKQFDGFVGSLVIEAFVSQPDGLQRFLLQASASDADTGSRGESITPSQTASTIGPAVGTCLDQ